MLRIGRLTRDEQPGAPLDPPGCAGASCHHAARQGDIFFRLHNVLVVSRAPSAADIPVGRSHARQGAQQSSHMVVAAIAIAFAAMSGAGGGRRETKHDGARHRLTAATLAQPQKYHAKHWKVLMNLQTHARNSKRSRTLWSEGATTDDRAGSSAGPTAWTPRHRPPADNPSSLTPQPARQPDLVRLPRPPVHSAGWSRPRTSHLFRPRRTSSWTPPTDKNTAACASTVRVECAYSRPGLLPGRKEIQLISHD